MAKQKEVKETIMEKCPVTGQSEPAIHGKIQAILDYGTIVQMLVKTDEESIYTVNWDHRMFSHLVEGLGRLPGKGERVIVHGEPFEQWLEFPDLEDEP